MDSLQLGVALLAEGEALLHAKELRQAISETVEIDPSYSLENIPHLTLFQNRFPAANLQAIKNAVERQCNSLAEPIELMFHNELYLAGNSRNVFWNCSLPKSLFSLHMQIVEALNPLREGLLMPQFAARLESPETEEREKQHIRRYGVRGVGELYLPHITLVKLRNEDAFSASAEIPIPIDCQMKATTVVVGRIGDAGDLLEQLDKFRLPQ